MRRAFGHSRTLMARTVTEAEILVCVGFGRILGQDGHIGRVYTDTQSADIMKIDEHLMDLGIKQILIQNSHLRNNKRKTTKRSHRDMRGGSSSDVFDCDELCFLGELPDGCCFDCIGC